MISQADPTPANIASARANCHPAWKHLSPRDCEVWAQFLALNLILIDEQIYDLRLAGPKDNPLAPDVHHQAMWVTLRKKRVDVILRSGAYWWLIEVKTTSSMSALGQLLTYRYHLRAEHPEMAPLITACVCEREDGDVSPLYSKNQILVLPTAEPRSGLDSLVAAASKEA